MYFCELLFLGPLVCWSDDLLWAALLCVCAPLCGCCWALKNYAVLCLFPLFCGSLGANADWTSHCWMWRYLGVKVLIEFIKVQIHEAINRPKMYYYTVSDPIYPTNILAKTTQIQPRKGRPDPYGNLVPPAPRKTAPSKNSPPKNSHLGKGVPANGICSKKA